jgi:hypothetical protein
MVAVRVTDSDGTTGYGYVVFDADDEFWKVAVANKL